MLYIPRKNDLFDDMFDSFFSVDSRSVDMMKTDIREKDGYYTLEIEVPGYRKEDINLEIASGYLTVSAKRDTSNEETDSKGRLLRSERSFGTCSRSYYVGDTIKASDIKARFENGILEIIVPSVEQKRIDSKETIMID
ncbi:MAG: Hsp20/alpha crystallin family protein [Erysipelotrichaceae bacterium]|nr:Hsp20/alpha crystallin family protein [Erysipelotrichaceae bacterium]